MKVKLYKFPKDAHFMFNGVEFVRKDYFASVNCYKCDAFNREVTFSIYLDPKTNVNPIESINDVSAC